MARGTPKLGRKRRERDPQIGGRWVERGALKSGGEGTPKFRGEGGDRDPQIRGEGGERDPQIGVEVRRETPKFKGKLG